MIRSFVCLFVHLIFNSFIHLFIHYFIYSFIKWFICSFLHSFIPLFMHSFIHSFIRSFIHLFIHPFIHSSIPSFLHSFNPSILHSFYRSFIYALTHFTHARTNARTQSLIHSPNTLTPGTRVQPRGWGNRGTESQSRRVRKNNITFATTFYWNSFC